MLLMIKRTCKKLLLFSLYLSLLLCGDFSLLEARRGGGRRVVFMPGFYYASTRSEYEADNHQQEALMDESSSQNFSQAEEYPANRSFEKAPERYYGAAGQESALFGVDAYREKSKKEDSSAATDKQSSQEAGGADALASEAIPFDQALLLKDYEDNYGGIKKF